MRSSLILLAVLVVLSSCTAPKETQTKEVVVSGESNSKDASVGIEPHQRAWFESYDLLLNSKKEILNPGVSESVSKAIKRDNVECELLAKTRQAKNFCNSMNLEMLLQLSEARSAARTK